MKPLTTLCHAYFVAFAKATGLAALTAVLVYSALICCGADVVIVSWKKEGKKEKNKSKLLRGIRTHEERT